MFFTRFTLTVFGNFMCFFLSIFCLSVVLMCFTVTVQVIVWIDLPPKWCTCLQSYYGPINTLQVSLALDALVYSYAWITSFSFMHILQLVMEFVMCWLFLLFVTVLTVSCFRTNSKSNNLAVGRKKFNMDPKKVSIAFTI